MFSRLDDTLPIRMIVCSDKNRVIIIKLWKNYCFNERKTTEKNNLNEKWHCLRMEIDVRCVCVCVYVRRTYTNCTHRRGKKNKKKYLTLLDCLLNSPAYNFCLFHFIRHLLRLFFSLLYVFPTIFTCHCICSTFIMFYLTFVSFSPSIFFVSEVTNTIYFVI